MCVDEQLVGFRGRCPSRVYMKSKYDRYGVKIWAICENPTGYVWNSQVYTGQQSSTPEKSKETLSTRLGTKSETRIWNKLR